MNDDHKRLTVMQISKYNSEISEFEKKSENNKWFVYGSIVLFIITSSMETGANLPFEAQCVVDILKYLGVICGIENVRRMIGNMARKVGLENLVEQLEYQMKFDDMADDFNKNDRGHSL